MSGTRGTAEAHAAGRYSAVPYFSLPHKASDPDRGAVVGRLHGLHPPDIGRARIVELACGDGGNLLSIAAARPDAELLGFDLEESAIARGREIAGEAELDHVDLRVADIRALRPEDVGEADYVIAHGLLSWAPADVRDAMFALAGAILDEDGIFVLSYNALPGWYRWMAARDIAQRATAAETGDAENAARVAVQAVREAAQLHGVDDSYSDMLNAAVERFERLDPWMLFHDDLNPHCTPFALSEVTEQAERHGLRYLGEAMPDHWWRWTLPDPLVERLRQGADPVARQQVADFVSGADFKSTLLVPSAAQPAPDVDVSRAAELHLERMPYAQDLPANAPPPVRALFDALAPAEAGALSVPLEHAARRARLKTKHVLPAAFRLAVQGRIAFRCYPTDAAVHPGDRPHASPLARAQARRSETLSTLTHERANVPQPAIRALITLLDGTRDYDALARDLAGAGPSWGFAYDESKASGVIGPALARLAEHGLLDA